MKPVLRLWIIAVAFLGPREALAYSRFYGTEEGTIGDLETSSLWASYTECEITYADALRWVQSLGDGWRLPNETELADLYREGIMEGSWGPFDGQDHWLPGRDVWTCETRPDYDDGGYASEVKLVTMGARQGWGVSWGSLDRSCVTFAVQPGGNP
jgi:hypothetical protein